MSDAPPPPPNSRISDFMMPPADWSSQRRGGRFVSKSDRFPAPKEQPFHCHSPGIADRIGRSPNAGVGLRSSSPRFPKTVARTPDVQVGTGSPSRCRTPTLRTSSPRLSTPRSTADSHSVLGPSDWMRERNFGHPVRPSPTFRSNSPRLSHHKAYEGPQSYINNTEGTIASPRRFVAANASFRYSSPRLPKTQTGNDNTSAPPSVLANGKSGVVARCDSRAGTLRNGGHAFGDGSRSK
jgi:hypothetical protein